MTSLIGLRYGVSWTMGFRMFITVISMYSVSEKNEKKCFFFVNVLENSGDFDGIW